MTQRIFYKCDAPNCDREVDEEGELRVVERTAFERGAVRVERRHACSTACEATLLREAALVLLARPSTMGAYRDIAKLGGAREEYVTTDGFTLLPADMIRDLDVEETGGIIRFQKVAGRWTAFKDGETACEVPVQGWYVLPGKRGFDGVGWFETRETAERGLERGVLGPFPTIHEARRAREKVYPVLTLTCLRDMLRMVGRYIPLDVVKAWSVADQHEAEAWAAFTLSDAQLGVRRAPPEPVHVKEGAVIKLRTNSMYGKFGGSASSVPVWRSPSGMYAKIDERVMVRPVDAWSVYGDTTTKEPPEPPTAAEPLTARTCGGTVASCPAALRKTSMIPSVVRVSWKTEDGTYSCDVDVAKGASFNVADVVITVDPLPVRPAAEFHQIAPTEPDRETAPTGDRPPPSAIERTAGIRYSETTPEERAAIDRIKSAYVDLSLREKAGSHTDVITDLTVAIVAEMRRVARDLHEVLDEGGADKGRDLCERIWSFAEVKTSLSIKVDAANMALNDAGAPADPSLFERVQWLARRATQADRVHVLLDEAGFASDTSLPGRVHDALTELLDGAGIAGQRPLKERVASLREQVTKQLSSERDALHGENMRLAEDLSDLRNYNERVLAERDVLIKDLRELREEHEKRMLHGYSMVSENVRALALERNALREQKVANDAMIKRLQTELRRQRDDLLAELNEVRSDRTRLVEELVEELNKERKQKEQWIATAKGLERGRKSETAMSEEILRLKREAALAFQTLDLLNRMLDDAGVEKTDLISHRIWSLRNQRDQMKTAVEETKRESNQPIPVVLHCPACGAQHVDTPDPEKGWTDPPHRSHLCASCGCVWRAADVPTRGVATPSTRGEKDTWPDPRGDGPGWYAVPGKIGWFSRRIHACASFASPGTEGPLAAPNAARALAGETKKHLDEVISNKDFIHRLLSDTWCSLVTRDQVRTWSEEQLCDAVTWAAYVQGNERHGEIDFIYEKPFVPAPQHVREAHESTFRAPC